MAQFLVTTTGLVSEVVFDDIGARTLTHPTVDIDLLLEFTFDELINSEDIQSAIDAGEITVKNEFGENITNVSEQAAQVIVSGGTNINITGTNSNPVVNTDDNVNFTSVSATTIVSGTTNLETIITTLAVGSEDITRVQPGVNMTTGGTDNFPIVNLQDDITLNSVNATFISGGTISGNTIYSAGTNVEQIIDDKINTIFSSVTNSCFDAFDALGGTVTTSTSWGVATVPLNSGRQANSDFSHDTNLNNDEVTINTAYKYLIMGRASIESSGSNSRTQAECRLEIDTGGGFVEVSGTTAEMYQRQNGFGATGSFFAILDLNIGDKVRISFRREQGGAGVRLEANGSALSIIKIVGGPRGATGPAGILENFSDLYVTGGTYSNVFSGNTIPASFIGQTFQGGDFIGDTFQGGTITGDGSGITGINSFGRITSPGEGAIVADNTSDTLNVVGVNIDISHNTGADRITLTGDLTRVQPGVNMTTGGTGNFPVVNLSDNINLTSVSANTFYSGATDLSQVISNSITSSTLGSLFDVKFTSATIADEVLYYNGSEWTSSLLKSLLDTSIPSTEVYIIDNSTTTVISSTNTPVQISSDNYNVDFSTSFSQSSGVVTYTGSTPVRLSIDAAVYFTSANNQDLNFYIGINTGATFAMINSSKGPSRTQGAVETTFANPKCLIEIVSGNSLAVFVENTTSTNNVVVTDMNWTINS